MWPADDVPGGKEETRPPRPLRGCALVAILGALVLVIAVVVVAWQVGDAIDSPDPDDATADATASADRIGDLLLAEPAESRDLAAVLGYAKVEGLTVDYTDADVAPERVWLRASGTGTRPDELAEVCVLLSIGDGTRTTAATDCPSFSPYGALLAYAGAADAIITGGGTDAEAELRQEAARRNLALTSVEDDTDADADGAHRYTFAFDVDTAGYVPGRACLTLTVPPHPAGTDRPEPAIGRCAT